MGDGHSGDGRSANDAVIEGRGVLSGEKLMHPPQTTDDLAMLNLCGSRIWLGKQKQIFQLCTKQNLLLVCGYMIFLRT